MQLNKKNPRDQQFTDAHAQYEEDFEVEETVEKRPEPATRTRQRPELEGDTPARAAAPRNESLVDAHSTFDGKYDTEQDLCVQGTISGEVTCRGTLTIEQGATARARIQARDAVVRGRLEGDIVCSGKLVLAATAVATGTLKAAAIVVEEGAALNGTVETVMSTALPAIARSADLAASAPLAESEVAPAAPAATRPNWGGERRPASNGTTPEPGARGRQTPNFAFVPTTDERAATADRN